MHELAICQALIRQVTDLAEARSTMGVSQLFVSIGPLSGVEAALLRNAFPIAAAGTVADGATLHINTLPVIIHCSKCDVESSVAANRLICDQCGGWRTKVVSGDELLLTRVEFELKNHTPPPRKHDTDQISMEG